MPLEVIAKARILPFSVSGFEERPRPLYMQKSSTTAPEIPIHRNLQALSMDHIALVDISQQIGLLVAREIQSPELAWSNTSISRNDQ